ncbi:MAG: hypothetical protein LUH02_04235 [Erysipelotrichaceae bacterium]|nr:hypothetical protein [Erysipelotrichaceae bacterium]
MVDGLQISFEKDIWFSEDINIERGYNLIDKLHSVDDFINNWEPPFRGEYLRTNIIFE